MPDEPGRCFEIEIHQGVSKTELVEARSAGTVKQSRLECPHCGVSTSMAAIRGDRRGEEGTVYGLRLWENEDLVPRPDDVFQERLYCIRWVETVKGQDGREERRRHYRAPNESALAREDKVLALLRERFAE
jgi:putative DNA methylase